MQDTAPKAGGGAPKPSWLAKLAQSMPRPNKAEASEMPPSKPASAKPSKSELDAFVEYCRGVVAENAQLRTALSTLRQAAASGPNGGKEEKARQSDVVDPERVNWEDAYWCLRDEVASLQRDNEALLTEVQGRKRSQYGRRSERVSPEELLAAMHKLKATEPQHIPDGMLEDLERECSERAAERARRKKKREEKRQKAADEAARRVATSALGGAASKDENDGNGDGDGDGDGGGGTGAGSNSANKEKGGQSDRSPSEPSPLRTARRNACLAGLTKREDIIRVPDDDRACPICKEERQLVGYQDSHMLDLVLPTFLDVVNKQEKLACQRHPYGGIAVAPAKARPISQGLPTALLLAFIVVAKLEEHLPLERQSGMYKRWGCRLVPSTLVGWFQAAGDLVEPLAAHLGKAILSSKECMLTDGSQVRVLDPTASHGSTRGGLWGYTVAGVGTYFRYTDDGSYADTRALLTVRQGPTMTDGHKGYESQRIPERKETIPVINGPHLNCLAHARRPYEAAFRVDEDLRAVPILRRIQALYAVEAEAKKKNLAPEAVKLLRDAKSRPIFDKLFEELEQMQAQTTPKSRFGRAIATMLNHKVHLGKYLDNGAWPIDNNLQEAQYRAKALGQHNWLFIGSHAAAPRYAALLTLVRSCVMLGIDPVTYLADVFMQLQMRGSARRLDELLPAAWKRARTVAPQQAPLAA